MKFFKVLLNIRKIKILVTWHVGTKILNHILNFFVFQLIVIWGRKAQQHMFFPIYIIKQQEYVWKSHNFSKDRKANITYSPSGFPRLRWSYPSSYELVYPLYPGTTNSLMEEKNIFISQTLRWLDYWSRRALLEEK